MQQTKLRRLRVMALVTTMLGGYALQLNGRRSTDYGVIDEADGRLLSMREVSRYLFLVGALPFIVLGLAHAALTPRSPAEAKGLSPRDPALREAMARDSIVLTRRTTVWLGWVGFNLTHSLGLALFGAVIVLMGRSTASFEAQADYFLPMAVFVSTTYLILGVRYFFRTPIIGIALASVCFFVSWVLFAWAG